VTALGVIEDEKLAEASARQGVRLKQAIQQLAERSPHVKEVRGKGLFIGIEVKERNAMVFCRKLVELGLIINDSHGHTIRVSPPLNITDEDADLLVDRLGQVLLDK
jgi:ornithine--oxo-acid transaminase